MRRRKKGANEVRGGELSRGSNGGKGKKSSRRSGT